MERDDGGRFILFIQRYFISLLSSRVSRVWLQWSRLASFFPTTIADVVKFAAADYFAYSAWRNSDEMVTSIILPWGRRVGYDFLCGRCYQRQWMRWRGEFRRNFTYHELKLSFDFLSLSANFPWNMQNHVTLNWKMRPRISYKVIGRLETMAKVVMTFSRQQHQLWIVCTESNDLMLFNPKQFDKLIALRFSILFAMEV